MRRPDNEPLLFDLPLDRPARDDEAEPLLDRQPPRAEPPPSPRPPRSARSAQATERAPAPRLPPPASPPLASAPRGARSAQSATPGPDSAAPDAAVPAATKRRPREPSGPRDSDNPRAERLPSAAFAGFDSPAGAAGAERLLGQAQLDLQPGTATAGGAPRTAAAAKPSAQGARVGIGRRLAAGAADLLVHVAVAVLALAGCRYLGVTPALRDWPAIAVFLLSFSFLYTVVPLAFWGHTLGMTWAGLTAESAEGEPLSFDQTARRWLGALLTLATLGLALLLALTGRSLSDRLSGSRTLGA
jgi:uncharacterized RDD family membrane protein YckC